jgi:hypothetical protein
MPANPLRRMENTTAAGRQGLYNLSGCAYLLNMYASAFGQGEFETGRLCAGQVTLIPGRHRD